MTGITAQSVEQKLDELFQEREALMDRVGMLDEKIAAFKTVIDEFRIDPGKPPPDLAGLSLEEALVALAEHNGGELSSYQARPTLVDAGLLHGDARQVSVKLYTALSGSKRFEQTGERGRYRLLSDSEMLDGLGIT